MRKEKVEREIALPSPTPPPPPPPPPSPPSQPTNSKAPKCLCAFHNPIRVLHSKLLPLISPLRCSEVPSNVTLREYIANLYWRAFAGSLISLDLVYKVKMAADSNTGFHQEAALGPGMNQRGISFQSGAVSSSSEMIGMGNYYTVDNSTSSLVFSGNSGVIGNNSPIAVAQAGNASCSLILKSASGLKHDTGLAVDWSTEEQFRLEEGLIKYADEPSIMRYIKIASSLREKTVRDVALRCRWVTRKRRKQEESHLGRKGSQRKEKLVESSSKANPSSASTSNMAAPSFSMQQMNQNERIKWEVIRSTARQLLDQNIQDFGEINQNLSSLALQGNISLFCRTRENINNLCAMMKEMPGRTSQMQQLPVAINQDLADRILPRTSPTIMLNMSNVIPPKQDFRYDGALPGVNV